MTDSIKVALEAENQPYLQGMEEAKSETQKTFEDLDRLLAGLGDTEFPLREEFLEAAAAGAKLQNEIDGLQTDNIQDLTQEVDRLVRELEAVTQAQPFEGQEEKARRLVLQITAAADQARHLARQAAAASVQLSAADQTRFDGLRQQLRQLNSQFVELRRQADFDPTSKEAQELERSIAGVTDELVELAGKGGRQAEVLRRGLKLVDASIEDLAKEARRARREVEGIGEKGASGLRKLGSGVAKIKNLLAGLNVGVALVEGLRLVGSSLDALQAKTQVVRGLTVALKGDNEAAAREYEFLGQTVDDLGFKLRELQNDYLQVTAAAEGTGVSQQEIRELFLGTLEAGRALGKTTVDLSGIFQAYTQILSKPTVATEELLQIAERFPGTFNRLARALGTTAGALQDDLRAGVLKARDVVVPFGRALREEFGAAAREAASDFDAAAARIANAADRIKASFAEGFAQPLASLAEDGSARLDRLDTSAQALGRSLGFVLDLTSRLLEQISKNQQANADLRLGLTEQEKRTEAVSAAVGRLLIQQRALEAGSGNLGQALTAVTRALVSVQLNGNATAEDLERIEAGVSTVTQAFLNAGREIPQPLLSAIREVERLKASLEAAGEEGAESLDQIGASADAAASRLAGLSEGARSVITGLEADQQKLEEQTRSLVEAYRFLSDEQKIQTEVGAALAEQVAVQVARYEEVPPALAAVAEALGVGEARAAGVRDRLEQVAGTFESARAAFEEGLPIEGLERAERAAEGLKEDLADLERLRQLQIQPRLDIDELNELNELSFTVPIRFEEKGQTLREVLAGNTGFGENGDGITVPVEFQPGGEEQIAAAIDRLKNRGRLTTDEQAQLDALEQAASGVASGLDEAGEAQGEFVRQSRLTEEILERGDQGFRDLTEATSRFRAEGVGAADDMEDLGGAAERTGRAFAEAGIQIRRATAQTEAERAQRQESLDILRRLQASRRQDATAARDQADATREGASAAGEFQQAADGATEALEGQAEAAERAGEAGEEGSRRAAEGAQTLEERLRRLEERVGRGQREAWEEAAQASDAARDRMLANMEALLAKCAELDACIARTGAGAGGAP